MGGGLLLHSKFKKPQNIEYRTPNVEVFFPDIRKEIYDEDIGRPEMSGRFFFGGGGTSIIYTIVFFQGHFCG